MSITDIWPREVDKIVRLMIKSRPMENITKTKLPNREDALRNREDILIAAKKVFCMQGIDVPLATIASTADVGRATLYRNFPDRHALLTALLDRYIDKVEEKANAFSEFPDGLFKLFNSHTETLCEYAPLVEYWRMIDRKDPAIVSLYIRLREIYKPLLEMAQKHQLCRETLTVEDMLLICPMLAVSLYQSDAVLQVKMAKHILKILMEGLTP